MQLSPLYNLTNPFESINESIARGFALGLNILSENPLFRQLMNGTATILRDLIEGVQWGLNVG